MSRDEKLRISNSDAVSSIINAVLALLRTKPVRRKDISKGSRSPKAAVSTTYTPWWGLPFLFFEYLLFALLGPGPARVTPAKSAIMATTRMTSFILMIDTVEMLDW